MTIKLTRITNILLLVAGIFIAPQAFAEVIIKFVDPDFGPQGEVVPVVIEGSGFGSNAEVVILSGNKPAPGITVRRTDDGSESTTTILADVDIGPDADIGDYTLKVSVGRGGKGTTATATFEVVQGNKLVEYCNQVFDGVVYPTDCDCKFVKKDEGGQGTPNVWLWVLQDDCETHTTLELPQYEVLNGNDHTLTAAADFDGTSVLTNAGHRTHVFSLNIQVDQDVAAGCGTGLLNSAISFVLDNSVGKEHPRQSTDKKGQYYDLTRLRVWGITVDSAVPLCKAIEFRRDPSYVLKLDGAGLDPSVYTDAEAQIYEVSVRSGSYSEAGLEVSGFVNAGAGGRSAEKIGVLKSIVMGAAPDSYGSAIRFGPVYGEGTVGQNAISAISEIGIEVEGNGQDNVTIENNDVVGAATAISVDGKVRDAYFKSNVLTGPGDIGIDTSACNNSYRSNRINDFYIDVHEGDCSLP